MKMLRVVVGLVLATAVCLSIHFPETVHISVRFVGDTSHLPRSATLYAAETPSRCIPIVNCTWSLWTHEWSLIDGSGHTGKREIKLPADGLDLDLPVASRFSFSALHVASYCLVIGSGNEDGICGYLHNVHAGSSKSELHILDVVGASGLPSLALPLQGLYGLHDLSITVDLDPIVDTAFKIPGQKRVLGHHCEVGPLELSPGVPVTIEYQPSRADLKTDAFLIDPRDLGEFADRVHAEEWAQLKALAFTRDNLKLTHDPALHRLTLLWTPLDYAPARQEIPFASVMVGTPGTDGRVFGTDCLILDAGSSP